MYPIVNTIEATDTRAVSDGLKAMGGAKSGSQLRPCPHGDEAEVFRTHEDAVGWLRQQRPGAD